MVESPRDELRIASITYFERSDKDEQWYWRTEAANAEPVGDGGQGYNELNDAVHGFLVQQGVDLAKVVAPEDAHLSELIKVTDNEYHIRRYAYGAPNPLQVTTDRKPL